MCRTSTRLPPSATIDDEAAWRAANPGLGTIKALDYMRAEVERVAGVPSDEPSFRAYDLNLALSPTREMVCSPADLEACFVDVAEYRGPCYVGLDIGEASSGTAAVAFWPQTGALRTWLAFGNVPDLVARGRRDGADYAAMERRGELRTYPGRTVPVDQFVLQVEADLDGAEVRSAVADGYRCGELLDVCPWPLEVVRSGTGPSGSAAVRAFQRAVLTKTLATVENYSLTNAIAESHAQKRRIQRQSGHRQGAVGWADRRAQRGGPGGGRGGAVSGPGPDGRLHPQPGRRVRLIPRTRRARCPSRPSDTPPYTLTPPEARAA